VANILLQRYDLAVVSPSSGVPLSGGQEGTVISPLIPLSGLWTVRLRWISAQVNALDNSGQLSILGLGGFWQFQNQGTGFYSLPAGDFLVTPTWQFPVVGNFGTQLLAWRSNDYNQVISSFDQLGQTATSVNANAKVLIKNADAAGPHSYTLQLNAILEFDDQGSS
jgi:hypothetical protein